MTTTLWEVLDAQERLVDGWLTAADRARRWPAMPVPAIITPENCMELFDAGSLASPVGGLLANVEDPPVD
jgi:hypothetical protein